MGRFPRSGRLRNREAGGCPAAAVGENGPGDCMTRRILVTAALPYANGHIHLGHLVEYIQTDIWVRFQKLRGHRCVFICADDTHGTAIMIRARQEGRSEQSLIADMRSRAHPGFCRLRRRVRQLRQHRQPGKSRAVRRVLGRTAAGGPGQPARRRAALRSAGRRFSGRSLRQRNLSQVRHRPINTATVAKSASRPTARPI